MTCLGWSTAALCLAVAAVSVPANAQTATTSQTRAQPAASSGLSIRVGTVEFRDLTFPAASGTWSIGRISFTGLAHIDGRTRAERIDIAQLVITAGSQTIEIPSIVITNADFPMPLFRVLTAGEAAGDPAGLVASATVDRIAIDRIVQRDPSAQIEASYAGVVFSGLRGGTIESMRAEASAATAPGAPGTTGTIRVKSGEIRYQQVDLAEMVRMVTGGGNGGAKRLLERAIVDGIEVVMDQATIRFKRLVLSDVEGRAPERPLPVPFGATALTREQQRLAAAYAGDFLRFMQVGRYHIEGITVFPTSPDRILSIGAVTVGGFSGRGIDRFEIKDFDFRLFGASVRFDRFEIDGIRYGALIETALKATESGAPPDFSPAQIARLMPRASALRLSRLDADTPQGPLAIGGLRFELADRGDTSNADAAIEGLRIDLGRLDPNDGRDQLMALGYDEIVAGAQASVSWLRNERAIVVRAVGMSVDQAGRIEIAARLDNVDIDKALADPAAAEDVLAMAHVGPIEIRIANLGLAERFYAAAAKDAGVSADAIRAGLAAEMRAQAIGNFGPLLADGSADAIAAFLRAPGTITARIALAAGQPPLTIAEAKMLAPPQLMQRLTVTLTAGPP